MASYSLTSVEGNFFFLTTVGGTTRHLHGKKMKSNPLPHSTLRKKNVWYRANLSIKLRTTQILENLEDIFTILGKVTNSLTTSNSHAQAWHIRCVQHRLVKGGREGRGWAGQQQRVEVRGDPLTRLDALQAHGQLSLFHGPFTPQHLGRCALAPPTPQHPVSGPCKAG